jgi:hypothetical protein
MKLGLLYRLSLYENRALKKIFEPMKDEGIGSWRKLHIEQFHSFMIYTP